jgi:hypothetical protein
MVTVAGLTTLLVLILLGAGCQSNRPAQQNPYASPLSEQMGPITGTWTQVYDCNDLETIQTWNIVLLRQSLAQMQSGLDALEKMPDRLDALENALEKEKPE